MQPLRSAPMVVAQIHLDYFPARVQTPSAVHDECRVIVACGRATVFSNPSGAPQVDADVAAPDPRVGGGGLPHRVQTEEGEWLVEHAGGCGCGSLLKAMPMGHLLGLVGVT
jgi:hypothetical protein